MTVAIETVEQEAVAAAQKGETLNEACPYPFASEAGRHFRLVHQRVRAELEGGAL